MDELRERHYWQLRRSETYPLRLDGIGLSGVNVSPGNVLQVQGGELKVQSNLSLTIAISIKVQ